MFCGGWGGGGYVREARSHRLQKRVRVVSSSRCLTRSCRAGWRPRGFPWPARHKPTDVGQSLGLPEQLGVVNAKHQDRSLYRISYRYANVSTVQLLLFDKYRNIQFNIIDNVLSFEKILTVSKTILRSKFTEKSSRCSGFSDRSTAWLSGNTVF